MELYEVPAAAPAAENATQDVKAKTEGELQRSEIDWEQYLDNYQTQHTSPPGSGGMSSEDLPSLESTLTRAGGLTEHLLEQLRMAGLTPEEERVGALLIGNLDRDGYLVLGPDGPTALGRELDGQQPGPAASAGSLSNGVETHAESASSLQATPHADAAPGDHGNAAAPMASAEAPAAPEPKANRDKPP